MTIRTPNAVASRLFLLLGLGTLDLGGTTEGLLSVLALLALLSGGLFDLLGHADTDKAEVGLELLHGLGGVVDEGEASGLAATELGAQAEDGDLVLAGLVHAGKLVAELILGDVGTVGVQDVTIQRPEVSQTCVLSKHRLFLALL